ncbi:regulator of microtubule dynamics protein 1 [Cephus cinctus]|uniref:Regulator of microtubule dynamics protein 1 n=1 Tax=Cephus cinctus TaxID=211228 RepID=A0AAJ7FDR7_CEPCN|nr:regulator of microtubule dynamics protein 1 [Cephus cinctus]XP_015586764.1 regulator of microtubule dynamics protein 1 [Cephus cinctus]XP_015586765.1 regulator of microtubule dynamics protein 1 [Cephus cinctus]
MSEAQNTVIIAAAIGAAMGVIGAAGLFIYQKVLEKRQSMMMRSNLDNMNQRILELQAELESLRLQQNQQRNRKKRAVLQKRFPANGSTYTATDNDTDVDAFSTAGTDFDDDEFYDFSDSEIGAGDNDNGTSEGVNEVDSMLASLDKQMEMKAPPKDVHTVLQNLANLHPNNVEVIWRLTKACYNCSSNTTDMDTKKTYILEGLKVCEKIISTPNANLYKWYAILVGLHGDFLPVKQKIANGHRFKEYVTKALELSPEDPVLYYLLGRFKYEVSALSWVERKIAATLFSDPPSATYEDALSDFEQSEKLGTEPNMDNRLFLAKTYIKLNRYQDAFPWLTKVLELPATDEEDRRKQDEADLLMTQYSKYR